MNTKLILSTIILLSILVVSLIMWLIVDKPLLEHGVRAELSISRVYSSSNREPRLRESNVTVNNVLVRSYETVKARDPVSAPSTQPLLAKFVDLDVTKGVRMVEFEVNVPQGELFLAIDGSSLSTIEVKITIQYPSSTVEEYVTRAGEPLHKLIFNPEHGVYRIKLSIERAWTRAWIQVVTLNNGTAVLESIEKQYRYMVPGEARYIRFNASRSDMVFVFIKSLRDWYTYVSLWKIPEAHLVWDGYGNEEYVFVSDPEGEYLLVIRSLDHTDVSYTVASLSKAALPLNLNEGRTLVFGIPFDVEIYCFNLEETWIALDWSVEPHRQGFVYSRIIIINPDSWIIYWDHAGPNELKHMVWDNAIPGKYVVIIIGALEASTVFKLTTLSGVIDLTNQPMFSLNITFTQPGQSIYYKVRSYNTFTLLVNPKNIMHGATVLSDEGHVRETYYSNFYATLLGEWSILKEFNVDYIIGLQATPGYLVLHLRPSNWFDRVTNTPDDSDFKFRFEADLVVLGISLTDTSYFAQFLASMDSTSRTLVWVIDPQGFVRNVALLREWYHCWGPNYWGLYICDLELFFIYRRGHEVGNLSGVWRIIALSDKVGVTSRVSQIKGGDEAYYTETPHHVYHTFSFDYELRSFKIHVQRTKWLSITVFNAEGTLGSSIYVYDDSLNYVAYHWLHDTTVKYTLLENVAEGVYTFFVAGRFGSNVSVSVVSHRDLLKDLKQTVTVTTTTTLPVILTVTRTVTSTETVFINATDTVFVTTTIPITVTETTVTTTTVHVTTTLTETVTDTSVITTTLPITVTTTETVTYTTVSTVTETETLIETTTQTHVVTETTTVDREVTTTVTDTVTLTNNVTATLTETIQRNVTLTYTATIRETHPVTVTKVETTVEYSTLTTETTRLETIYNTLTQTVLNVQTVTEAETITAREVVKQPAIKDPAVVSILAILLVAVVGLTVGLVKTHRR